MPAARPQAAMAPRYFVIERILASVVEPTLSMPPAQRSLASDLDPRKLTEITHEIGLEEVVAAGAKILAGQVRGRIVVKIL